MEYLSLPAVPNHHFVRVLVLAYVYILKFQGRIHWKVVLTDPNCSGV